jgi:fatty-acyl-CoA synthase
VTAPASLEAPLVYGAQLDARAQNPASADRLAIRHDDRAWTYREYRDEAVRMAHFLRGRLGRTDERRPAHVVMMLENHPELMALFAGCAYAGATLFGVNTGLRGETLAGVINQSRGSVLVVDERFLGEIERVRGSFEHLPDENVLVVPTTGEHDLGDTALEECLCREVGKPGVSLDTPALDLTPETNLMVIYTSGTTGLPKGINNNHMKLCLIGLRIATQLELTGEAVGYACMPLFHSNAMFLGAMPAFWAGGSLAMRERFSASAFVPDVLRYGVTYWNYVGEPVHYILGALRKAYGDDEERILAEVAGHPDNHLRYAVGNGAAPPDIDRFIRWLGLEDMLELYGSTEAAISTFRKLGDPRGSVGEITDEQVKVLKEDGSVCPPAELDADGKIRNYDEAVGEICRVAEDTALFQGYFDNADANASKYRDGVYYSGDLGHVLVRDETRFLFFDGRTDDWIRKDGENFSAAQVARLIQEHEDVVLAAAYGVPCAVSDELVMVALKLRPGARFDPQAFFDFCEHEVVHGGMDRKWLPDFVRVVEEFEYTQTQKVLVRNLKAVHYDRRRLPDAALYWRERGDPTFRVLSPGDFEAIRARFEQAERAELLDR